ncbi:MAG: hypothetical protein MSG64_14990, partial [Pyrinomonadaceae bacterium MAG19_C2-C3]|nr:hypothetical protein [Pyrinomonadaceae bacterium MAG19_C2-C3]
KPLQLALWYATYTIILTLLIPITFTLPPSACSLDRYSISVICRETRLRPASLRKQAAPPQRVPTSPAPLSASFLHLNAADLVPPHASAPARSRVPAVDSSPRLIFASSAPTARV